MARSAADKRRPRGSADARLAAFITRRPPSRHGRKVRSATSVGDRASSPCRTRLCTRERPVCLVIGSQPMVASRPLEADARERILATSYELFSRRGIRDVGVDEVIDRAGVAKATLYRHFPSKDDLVITFLELREERWTMDWVEAEARRRGTTPEERLLAIFALFDRSEERRAGKERGRRG